MNAMKLGTQTGSLINHVMSGSNHPEPEIGMGVTILSWTDRHPGTIISIECKNCQPYLIGITRDSYKRIDKNGMSESQEYTFETDWNDKHQIFYKKDKNGNWRSVTKSEKDRWIFCDNVGNEILIGRREKYHDFSF